VLVVLDPYQHGYFHRRVARQFPEEKTYILHGNRGTLQLLMNGSVNAMVADSSPRLALACLHHLNREGGAAKTIVLKTEPALRANDALQRAHQLRKLELLGKIAAP